MCIIYINIASVPIASSKKNHDIKKYILSNNHVQFTKYKNSRNGPRDLRDRMEENYQESHERLIETK